MDGISRTWSLAATMSVVLALVAGISGCAIFKNKPKPKPDDMGIMSPHDEIVALQKMALDAPKQSEAVRKKRTTLLVKAIEIEKDPAIRAEIVRTLAAYPSAASSAVFHAACKDPDTGVRLTVCPILGKQGDTVAVVLLSNLLKSDLNIDVRLAAARALGDTHNQEAVTALATALEDHDPAMQVRAVKSLQAVTGKDFDENVEKWRYYVKGETPPQPDPPSLAERIGLPRR